MIGADLSGITPISSDVSHNLPKSNSSPGREKTHPARQKLNGRVSYGHTSRADLYNRRTKLGETAASQEDQEITRRLKETGDTLGIRVLDQVVLGMIGSSRLVIAVYCNSVTSSVTLASLRREASQRVGTRTPPSPPNPIIMMSIVARTGLVEFSKVD
jgi:hypothetical protein